MKVFLVSMIVVAALLIALVSGVWWYTAGILKREAILTSNILPDFELAYQFTSAAAGLQSRGLLLRDAQSSEELLLRKQELESSISATAALIESHADWEGVDVGVLANTIVQIQKLVIGLSDIRSRQLDAFEQLQRAADEHVEELRQLSEAIQARVEELTDELLAAGEVLSEIADTALSPVPESTFSSDTLALFEAASLNIQDYLLFNQDMVRLKAVIEQVPLLRSDSDVTIAEQQRDLLVKTMVGRAIYVSDDQSAELLLTPLTAIRSSLRGSDNLFAAQRANLKLDFRQIELSSQLTKLIDTLPAVTEEVRSRSKAMLLKISAETLKALSRYRWFLFAALAASLIVLGLISYWLLYRQTVVPLGQITAQLDKAGTPQFENVERQYFIREMEVLSHAVNMLDKTQKQTLEKDAQLSASNIELLRANEELEQFAHVASHDLQEPLRKLQQFSGLLEEDYDSVLDEDGKFYLQAIAKSANRMSVMIRDTLEYARTARLDQPVDRVDLAQLVEALISDMTVAVTESGAQLTIAELPCVKANATGMSQLFRNLLLNAVKYRREGVEPHIRVETRQSDSENVLIIEILDNGIGIDSKYLSQVFSPFERVSSTGVTGTGLGLAICYKVCVAHGWKLDVTSEPDKGSCFRIAIPTADVLS